MKSYKQFIAEQSSKIKIGDAVPVRSFVELNKLAIEASKKHKDSYILAYVDFGRATIFAAKRLPTNAYASDDWKLGYWRNGKHFNWSDARKRATQRAVDKLSGTQ
jgi:hypothetical protein